MVLCKQFTRGLILYTGNVLLRFSLSTEQWRKLTCHFCYSTFHLKENRFTYTVYVLVCEKNMYAVTSLLYRRFLLNKNWRICICVWLHSCVRVCVNHVPVCIWLHLCVCVRARACVRAHLYNYHCITSLQVKRAYERRYCRHHHSSSSNVAKAHTARDTGSCDGSSRGSPLPISAVDDGIMENAGLARKRSSAVSIDSVTC